MRLLTYLADGERRLGALVGDQVVDLAAAQAARTGGSGAIAEMRALIAAGPDVWARLASDLATNDLSAFSRPLAETKLAAPVQPSKICAIGLNYLDHVLEGGRPIPKSPVLFAKLPSAVIGPGDTICWEPALSDKIDWEAELAVVIGRTARRVRAADAYDYVFGYTCADDVSARTSRIATANGRAPNRSTPSARWGRGSSRATRCPTRTACPSAARSTVRWSKTPTPIS